MDFTSIDTWDKITSFIGFAITIATLFVAENARRAVNKIQKSITFDKRIPQHLREMDKNLASLNGLLNNQASNINEINNLLGPMLSELYSVRSKVNDTEIRSLIDEASLEIRTIRKLSYTSSQTQTIKHRIIVFFTGKTTDVPNLIRMNYIKLSEIYTAVDNMYKDSKTEIRR